MSRQVRYRVVALALGGFLLGAPLLINGTASAGQLEGVDLAGDSGRKVTFGGGGVLGLKCHSRPDVESMTVPAGSTVRLVNDTGRSAKLSLGGTSRGSIPPNGATDVVFRRGTTEVQLSPGCAFGARTVPLLVTVAETEPPTDPGSAAPPDDSSAVAADPDDSDSPATTFGPAHPDALAPGVRHPTATRHHHAQSARTHADGPGVVAGPRPGPPSPGHPARQITTRPPRGTGPAAPAVAGRPPGDRRALVSSVPPVPSSSVGDAAPVVPAAPTTQAAAAEPVASMSPVAPSRPSGLLTMTAIVCVIGVAVGAIRAFVSQRASRTAIT
jgi:hypothetical protein